MNDERNVVKCPVCGGFEFFQTQTGPRDFDIQCFHCGGVFELTCEGTGPIELTDLGPADAQPKTEQ